MCTRSFSPSATYKKLLLRIAREGDVPHRAGTERLLLDERFLDERAVGMEHLDAIVHAIADIQQIVVRKHGAVHRIAELLRGRRVRIVRAEVGIAGLVAVSAPMPLVAGRCRRRTRSRGDCRSHRRRRARWSSDRRKSWRRAGHFRHRCCLCCARACRSACRNLPSSVNLRIWLSWKAVHPVAGLRLFVLAIDGAARALGSTAIAAQPDVAFVIHRDSMRRFRPIVTRVPGRPSAPMRLPS